VRRSNLVVADGDRVAVALRYDLPAWRSGGGGPRASAGCRHGSKKWHGRPGCRSLATMSWPRHCREVEEGDEIPGVSLRSVAHCWHGRARNRSCVWIVVQAPFCLHQIASAKWLITDVDEAACAAAWRPVDALQGAAYATWKCCTAGRRGVEATSEPAHALRRWFRGRAAAFGVAKSVVADGVGGVDGFPQVLVVDGERGAGRVSPHAAEAVSLQLDPNRGLFLLSPARVGPEAPIRFCTWCPTSWAMT